MLTYSHKIPLSMVEIVLSQMFRNAIFDSDSALFTLDHDGGVEHKKTAYSKTNTHHSN